MVTVMFNDKLVYKVVIWVLFGVILWNEKEALRKCPFKMWIKLYQSNKCMFSKA